MATKSDLRRLTLSFMTVIDDTEDPSATQARTLDIYIASVRALLNEKGLCWWDDDDIPDAVLIPMRRFVAAVSCGDFGRAGKGFEAGEGTALLALASLKSSDQRETVRGEYF